MTIHSRYFGLALLGAALFTGLGAASAQQTVRIREDIDVVVNDPQKLDALKLAFDTLKNSPNTQASLRAWANIHGAVPPDVSAGPCEHRNELIWAWHRAYLWEVETALRNSHPPETSNVTIPYWNWTAPPSGKRYPKAYEDTASSLYHINRLAGTVTQPPVPVSIEATLLNIPLWEAFGSTAKSHGGGKGQLESAVHDTVHGFVGRDMGSTLTSARDPIFYAHHANLDRIWLEWQKKWQLDPIDLDEPLKGVPGNYLQRNWLDVSTKSAYGPKAVPTPPVPPPGPAPFVFRAEQQLVKEGLSPAFAPEQRLQPQARVLLQLTNVTYPRNVGPFVSARVYLHPKDVKPAEGGTQFCETYFLGYFTDWQGDHGPHDAAQHAAANNLTLDVTERARAIQNMAGNAELVISFEFTRQADDGKVEPLKYGGPDGVSMNVRLEVVRPENGKAVNVQSIKTTQLP